MAASMATRSMRQTSHRGPAGSPRAFRPSVARPARSVVAVRAQADAAELSKWSVVYQYLKQENLRSIAPEEVKARVDSGEWVLADVRLAEQYDDAHAEGAVSVPMYRTITMEGLTLARVFKFFMYKANGVNPVDLNEGFEAALQVATANGTKSVVFMCEGGGTMQGSVNFPLGISSRSLQAAYKALKSGYKVGQVAHCGQGMFGWSKAELPVVGDYKPDVGRTPAAAAPPTIPDAKEKKEEGTKGFFGLFPAAAAPPTIPDAKEEKEEGKKGSVGLLPGGPGCLNFGPDAGKTGSATFSW